jgi:hypothetical protein
MTSPCEDMGIAAEWFDQAAIGEADRRKIGPINVQGLFHFQANRPNLKGESGHLGVVDSSEIASLFMIGEKSPSPVIQFPCANAASTPMFCF